METLSTDKAAGKKPAEEKGPNDLGLSRHIYAAGFSLKDGLVWGAATFLSLWVTFTLGKNLKPIQWTKSMLGRAHSSMWGWFKETTISIMGHPAERAFNRVGDFFKGPVIALSLSVAYVVSHIAMGPGYARGLGKAQKAIDKYNQLCEMKQQLMDSNKILVEDNERLKTALAEAEQGSKSHVERSLAVPATQTGMSPV